MPNEPNQYVVGSHKQIKGANKVLSNFKHEL